VDYAGFVRHGRARWAEFETRLQTARSGRALTHDQLEALAVGYRQVLHDHALAAARYPGTAIAERLRALAVSGTHWLSERRARRSFSPLQFYGDAFPRAVRAHAPLLGVAVALFLSAALFGLFLAVVEPSVGMRLLGPRAIAGLREGRLWTDSLVSVVPPSITSSAIATNNMSVALTAWAGGALAGLGALWVLLWNGLFLGIVFGTVFHYGMADRLGEFVAAHGPLELTLIVVSAAGGLGLGRALVAPDDRPRRVALADAGDKAGVLLLGCLPFFLLLGVVEAFLSPSPSLSVPFKAALGACLLAAFLAIAFQRPQGEQRPR